eukprot:217596-Chlamydomonas_euryale.AAC.2
MPRARARSVGCTQRTYAGGFKTTGEADPWTRRVERRTCRRGVCKAGPADTACGAAEPTGAACAMAKPRTRHVRKGEEGRSVQHCGPSTSARARACMHPRPCVGCPGEAARTTALRSGCVRARKKTR